jgi:hypothetical protein
MGIYIPWRCATKLQKTKDGKTYTVPPHLGYLL